MFALDVLVLKLKLEWWLVHKQLLRQQQETNKYNLTCVLKADALTRKLYNEKSFKKLNHFYQLHCKFMSGGYVSESIFYLLL